MPDAEKQYPVTVRAGVALDFAELALSELRRIRVRDETFGQDLFGDPAWSMMLDLFAATEQGKVTTISNACLASNAPPTTALRYISALAERGLISRERDDADKRRVLLKITIQAQGHMRDWLKLAK